MCFLTKCKSDEYYELFSGKKLEKGKQHTSNILVQDFDTPYIKKVEHLSRYLKDKNTTMIDINLYLTL